MTIAKMGVSYRVLVKTPMRSGTVSNDPFDAPEIHYRGDDLQAAIEVFANFLADKHFGLRPGVHRITGEPSVYADGSNGRLLAALYGVSLETLISAAGEPLRSALQNTEKTEGSAHGGAKPAISD